MADSIYEVLASSTLKLQELKLSAGNFRDEHLAAILDFHSRPMSVLELNSCGFGVLAFQSLIRHFASLTVLSLNGCNQFTSAMVHQVMTSCAQLETLVATWLCAQEIIGTPMVKGEAIDQEEGIASQPQDWVCTNLSCLRLYIYGLEGNPVGWHWLILKQLGRLTKLETLIIGPYETPGPDCRDGIDLRLEAGLGQLSSLKKLSDLRFSGLQQQMDEEDVQWMLDSWPSLDTIYGRVHHSDVRREDLEKILEERVNLIEWS
jgi:hypothetical protein